MQLHTPNRLEANWEKIKPLIQAEWPSLSEADLNYADKRYEVLVSLVRQRYGGRTEIIQEASVRERLNELLRSVEN